ncbi:CubicO group peptidase (beta-lactamase class C family) [Streptomyces griseochromogenes]|uniref:CubicO group peptidase (Beta-lactamase class C family) n=1 Tax=Streptomyces griseochromogenes TaxID=68214 RepID=A0A1B1B216_9ACTN|nr:serine hydrolase [Streptomyces griseochromogenes]ANP52863.1 serine hydrolase [Streptomyces griseochromogenes]MBP2047488.1 CubicO group peptidase (beta-lactamase class C family) [Streptomyces griseochromogenes]
MTDEVATRLTRRQLGALTLGGALALIPLPVGPAEAAPLSGAHRPTLRHGSPERAGLLGEHLRRLVTEAETFLGPSPEHPWYAGAVLLAGRGGTVALHRPIGMAVRYAGYDEKTDTGIELPAGRHIPMAEDTVFDLASLSKLFTSLLAVRQLERGTLELEATVASYLPDFGRAGKERITIRQLLTHTSGFRDWIPLYKAPTYEEKLRLIWNEAPLNPPGTAYLYSDLNLISLQLVLEKTTGRPLDALLREEITAPLGLARTRYNPPASWKPEIAATEDARPPWSGLNRGLVWGEVHDENAFSLGGVAGHAGVFSCAWDLAVLARTLLNGGVYGRARILEPESVDLMFTNFNTAFPGHEHGLGFELYQHWYMGAMATPRTAGHTGFTGTSLVLDPTTDSFLVVLGNSVHPVRTWRSGSAPRVAAGTHLARAVPVRPAGGRTAWFSGTASATTATLTLPAVDTSPGAARLCCALWWDIEPAGDVLVLEATTDDGTTWQPVPFTTERDGEAPQEHPGGSVTGWSGRVWHRLTAKPPAARQLTVRWRYTTDRLYVGRGAYVDASRIEADGEVVFDEARPADAARIQAVGWTASAD